MVQAIAIALHSNPVSIFLRCCWSSRIIFPLILQPLSYHIFSGLPAVLRCNGSALHFPCLVRKVRKRALELQALRCIKNFLLTHLILGLVFPRHFVSVNICSIDFSNSDAYILRIFELLDMEYYIYYVKIDGARHLQFNTVSRASVFPLYTFWPVYFRRATLNEDGKTVEGESNKSYIERNIKKKAFIGRNKWGGVFHQGSTVA